MNRRLIAAGAAVAIVAGVVLAWKKGPHVASPAFVKLEPGPLFIGSVDASTGSRSAACGAQAERPEGRAMRVGTRSFFVWGPPADGNAKAIVLAFHGWASSGRAFQKWFELEKYVEGGAYVAYPDSAGENWDYTGARDIDFVASIVDSLAASYCVDTNRVLALGFSYGGRFVNHLACKRPSLVRGIVVAGSRWDEAETTCVSPMPVLVVHRTRDKTMPIGGGRNAAERWAKIDGCGTTQPITNGCLAWTGCQTGAVTFCEDTHFDPDWQPSWNHTMRESYELLAWRWFEQLK